MVHLLIAILLPQNYYGVIYEGKNILPNCIRYKIFGAIYK